MLFAKRVEEKASGFVVADNTDGEYGHAERGEVVDGVGATTGDYGPLAMTKDQDRGFARHAGYLAVNELVSDKVGEDGDGEAWESGDDATQTVGMGGFRQGAIVMKRRSSGTGNRRGRCNSNQGSGVRVRGQV